MTAKRGTRQRAVQSIVLQTLGRVAPVGSWCLEVEQDRFTTVLQPPRPIIHDRAELERLVRRPYELLEAGSAAVWSSALEAARETGCAWDLVLESRSPSGAHGWIRTIGRAETLEGRVTRLFGVVQDITLLVAVERGLLRLQDQKTIERVASGLNELSELLAAVKQYQEAAVEALPEWHPVQHDLSRLADALGKGREIMGEILSSPVPDHAAPISLDLAEVIAEIYPAMRRAVGPRVLVDLIRTTRLSPVLADRVQLEDALLTLVLSARDRMRGGGALTLITRDVVARQPLVTLTGVRPAGAYVELAVTDSGAVMDENARARLFRPCLESSSGVELLKCLRIVRQFDGVMDVVSSAVGGTTVLLWLPAARAADRLPSGSPDDSAGEEPG